MENATANQIHRNAIGTAATVLILTKNTQAVPLENRDKWEMECATITTTSPGATSMEATV